MQGNRMTDKEVEKNIEKTVRAVADAAKKKEAEERKKRGGLQSPAVSLRIVARALWSEWRQLIHQGDGGLGEIHGLWNIMFREMEALANLEKVVAETGDGGSDFRPVKGFEQYGEA